MHIGFSFVRPPCRPGVCGPLRHVPSSEFLAFDNFADGTFPLRHASIFSTVEAGLIGLCITLTGGFSSTGNVQHQIICDIFTLIHTMCSFAFMSLHWKKIDKNHMVVY